MSPHMTHDIHIVGGGIAGSEAATQLAQAGHKVLLPEIRGDADDPEAFKEQFIATLRRSLAR